MALDCSLNVVKIHLECSKNFDALERSWNVVNSGFNRLVERYGQLQSSYSQTESLLPDRILGGKSMPLIDHREPLQSSRVFP